MLLILTAKYAKIHPVTVLEKCSLNLVEWLLEVSVRFLSNFDCPGAFLQLWAELNLPVVVPWAAAVQDWALGASVFPAPSPLRALGRQGVKLPLPENRGGQSWELLGSNKEEKNRKFGTMEERGEVEMKVGKSKFEKEGIIRGRTRL